MTSRQLRSGATISLSAEPEAHAEHARDGRTRSSKWRWQPILDPRASHASLYESEADGPGHLKRIPLVRGAIAELLEEFDASIESVIRKHQVRHEPQRIDGVPLAGLILADCWPCLCRRLCCPVPREPDLQPRRTLCERERPERRAIETDGVARLRARARAASCATRRVRTQRTSPRCCGSAARSAPTTVSGSSTPIPTLSLAPSGEAPGRGEEAGEGAERGAFF